MKMTIMFNCKTTIIFDPFTVENCYQYPIALVIVFLISIFYEFVLSVRCAKVCELAETQHSYDMIESSGKNIACEQNTIEVNLRQRILLTAYYALIVFLSYLVMFILMTYNFGIIMTAIIGNAIGYMIFFNTKSMSMNTKKEKSTV